MGSDDGSRPASIALCIFTIRLMENWRRMFGAIMSKPTDADTTLIIVAVTSICSEKFTRSGLETELHSLSVAMPEGLLAKCNVSSIAAATGLNRETVRRKVAELERLEVLQRETGGGLRVSAAVAARPEIQDMIQSQMSAVRRLLDQLRVIPGPLALGVQPMSDHDFEGSV